MYHHHVHLSLLNHPFVSRVYGTIQCCTFLTLVLFRMWAILCECGGHASFIHLIPAIFSDAILWLFRISDAIFCMFRILRRHFMTFPNLRRHFLYVPNPPAPLTAYSESWISEHHYPYVPHPAAPLSVFRLSANNYSESQPFRGRELFDAHASHAVQLMYCMYK